MFIHGFYDKTYQNFGGKVNLLSVAENGTGTATVLTFAQSGTVGWSDGDTVYLSNDEVSNPGGSVDGTFNIIGGAEVELEDASGYLIESTGATTYKLKDPVSESYIACSVAPTSVYIEGRVDQTLAEYQMYYNNLLTIMEFYGLNTIFTNDGVTERGINSDASTYGSKLSWLYEQLVANGYQAITRLPNIDNGYWSKVPIGVNNPSYSGVFGSAANAFFALNDEPQAPDVPALSADYQQVYDEYPTIPIVSNIIGEVDSVAGQRDIQSITDNADGTYTALLYYAPTPGYVAKGTGDLTNVTGFTEASPSIISLPIDTEAHYGWAADDVVYFEPTDASDIAGAGRGAFAETDDTAVDINRDEGFVLVAGADGSHWTLKDATSGLAIKCTTAPTVQMGMYKSFIQGSLEVNIVGTVAHDGTYRIVANDGGISDYAEINAIDGGNIVAPFVTWLDTTGNGNTGAVGAVQFENNYSYTETGYEVKRMLDKSFLTSTWAELESTGATLYRTSRLYPIMRAYDTASATFYKDKFYYDVHRAWKEFANADTSNWIGIVQSYGGYVTADLPAEDGITPGHGNFRYLPTSKQIQVMAHSIMANGASGVLYWPLQTHFNSNESTRFIGVIDDDLTTYNTAFDGTRPIDGISAISTMIANAGNSLMEGHASGSHFVATDNIDVKVTSRSYAGDNYTYVVNIDDKNSNTAGITLGDYPATLTDVFSANNQQYSAKGGQASITLSAGQGMFLKHAGTSRGVGGGGGSGIPMALRRR